MVQAIFHAEIAPFEVEVFFFYQRNTSDGAISNFITIPTRVPIRHYNSDCNGTSPDSDTCNKFTIIFRL